jgi:hypothetical protein
MDIDLDACTNEYRVFSGYDGGLSASNGLASSRLAASGSARFCKLMARRIRRTAEPDPNTAKCKRREADQQKPPDAGVFARTLLIRRDAVLVEVARADDSDETDALKEASAIGTNSLCLPSAGIGTSPRSIL